MFIRIFCFCLEFLLLLSIGLFVRRGLIFVFRELRSSLSLLEDRIFCRVRGSNFWFKFDVLFVQVLEVQSALICAFCNIGDIFDCYFFGKFWKVDLFFLPSLAFSFLSLLHPFLNFSDFLLKLFRINKGKFRHFQSLNIFLDIFIHFLLFGGNKIGNFRLGDCSIKFLIDEG